MNPIFEGKVRTKTPGAFRDEESRLQGEGFPWKFGNAFAFHVDTPKEFHVWKKGAERVRQARWNVEEREYKVTFPEV